LKKIFLTIRGTQLLFLGLKKKENMGWLLIIRKF